MTSKKQSSKKSQTASDAVDDQLARYRAMRDFGETPEPGGSKTDSDKTRGTLPFVIQKHAATRLHYDFRLGWNGVLKSWAVAKGPSYNPKDKRLAVEVEDHPIGYGGFEGTIPKGQYGGGTVMVWDHGTWEPQDDAEEGLRKGNLKFILHGEKLKGKWVLVRMADRGNHFSHNSKPNWLLIKEHDEFERGEGEEPITEESPDSVVTGRDLDAIAAAEDHVWQSNRPEKQPANHSRLHALRERKGEASGTAKSSQPMDEASAAEPIEADALANFPKEKLPGFVPPQLATLASEAPAGEDWLHELKLDGYRIQIRVEQKRAGAERKAGLFTRKGLDWTHRMPDVAAAAAQLPVQAAILDGEMVVLDEHGGTSFADLQAAFDEGARHPMTYFAFDLLHLNGHNLRGAPLTERKALLARLLGEPGTIRFSDHIRGGGDAMFGQACQIGAEGIISKQASAPYSSGRSKSWLKLKCVRQQEFVVGGYTLPSDGGPGIGALLLGYYEDGELVYAGRAGTGYTQTMGTKLRGILEPLHRTKPEYTRGITPDAKKNAIWVKPELVVEVHFTTWTKEFLVRQAAFLGIREDKQPKEVTREVGPPTPKQGKHKPEQQRAPESPKAASKSKAAPSAAKASSSPRVAAKTKAGDFVLDGVKITHPDKAVDEATGVTKRQLAEYYDAVAKFMLPHIANRPLSIVRCPEGGGKPCFFQKHIGRGVPAGIESVPVRDKKGGPPEDYLTISRPEGLIGLAQMAVLEVHPWGSTNDHLEVPDRIVIDLDPDPAIPWEQLVKSALEVQSLMKQLGLETFVKTTGGKGIHVVAPIAPRREWPAVKEFAHEFVQMMERAHPKLYLTKMTKAARKDRIYLDYLRNDRGATAVAAYSPRARVGLPVAVPLTWSELKKMDRPEFSVANFATWKSRLKRDPWAKLGEVDQELTEDAMRAVREMSGAA